MFVRDYLNFDLLIETATDGQRRPGSAELPWEYLYARPLHRFLVLSEQTTLVRYLEVGYPSQPLAVTSPRHMLAVAVGGLAFQEGVVVYSRLFLTPSWKALPHAIARISYSPDQRYPLLPCSVRIFCKIRLDRFTRPEGTPEFRPESYDFLR